jgi:hypothetical protein
MNSQTNKYTSKIICLIGIVNVVSVPKIYIDEYCEVHDLLNSIALGDFVDFDAQEIRPGAVYVLGRDTMIRCNSKIRNIVETGLAHIIFSNPAEGAATMLGQFQRFGTQDLIESGKIMVLSGGDLPNNYRYFQFENFCQRLMNFEENITCMTRTDEIYNKPDKPYTFLFLNGRMRPQRRWLLLKLQELGLLEQSLYTNLDAKDAPDRELKYVVDGKDYMSTPAKLKYLPAEYEVDLYRDQVDKPSTETNVKFHLFKNEWGEAYIKPEPYIDTYFSLVTETVFVGRNSFRTEKIWKPIIMGHPWIAVANTGFYQDMHNLGFKTFGNIIDETFDWIVDPQKRIEYISYVVKELCSSNLSDFMLQCKSICKYNQQHMLVLHKTHVSAFPTQFINFIKANI